MLFKGLIILTSKTQTELACRFEGRAGAALVKQLEIHQSEGVPMGHLDKRKAELEAAARASAEEADAAALARAERASQLMVRVLKNEEDYMVV